MTASLSHAGKPMSDSDSHRYRRVVRVDRARRKISWSSFRPVEIWNTISSYIGLGRIAPTQPILTPKELAHFLDTRASFVAQTSLYGYLRTRAGMRYPELFDDDPFVEGINIAKWHIWLDCLSDLSVYAGSRMAQQVPRETPRIAGMMNALVDGILVKTGHPAEAGREFPAHADKVRDRVRRVDWLAVGKDEAAFTESPDGLMLWSPVMDELKELDEEVVRNSIRFRWQEVRRDLAQYLDVQAVLEAAPGASEAD
jgi:hypothetical protein